VSLVFIHIVQAVQLSSYL